MSRNKMRNSQSMHWMGVVKWVLIAGILAVLGLSYMLCKNQNLHLAEETRRAQKLITEIQSRNETLEADLQHMKSMNLLERRLAFMHSTLVPWGDPRAAWVRLDQNTRARVAHINAIPTTSLNLDSSVMAQQSGH